MTPALQERAHSKAAALVDVLTRSLTRRGTAPPSARLAAQVAMAVFDRASRRWADDPATDLGAAISRAADEVRELDTTASTALPTESPAARRTTKGRHDR